MPSWDGHTENAEAKVAVAAQDERAANRTLEDKLDENSPWSIARRPFPP
jgi:hypothetical protein